jgi:hypothetical protein
MKVMVPYLGDDDPMPFGKYKGRRMRDVPRGYLFAMKHGGFLITGTPLAEYCHRHREGIAVAGIKEACWFGSTRHGGCHSEGRDSGVTDADLWLPGDPSDYGDR